MSNAVQSTPVATCRAAKTYRYENVFAHASFQFCGHIDEYLIENTRHLCLIYFQTRFGKGGHILRRYEEGQMVEERSLSSRKSIIGYYYLLWKHWRRELDRFRCGRGPVVVLAEHPLVVMVGLSRKNVRTVFWQWDYFPGTGLTDRLFNCVAKYCARRCFKYIPLTSAIGKAMGFPQAKPMMLGVTPPTNLGARHSNRVLMVGQLRAGQGVEDVLDFLAEHSRYTLSLMGAAANGFEETIQARIVAAGMADRVYFPNRFVTDAELRNEAGKCFVSLALYDTSPNNLTHYADPGKVKSSIEMGLPVIMTRVSEIAPFIERFKAGVVVDSLQDLSAAAEEIRKSAPAYFAGCRDFARCFEYGRIYSETLVQTCEAGEC